MRTTRLRRRAAWRLIGPAALVAICLGMLAAPALASAANPLSGALDALRATAAQQLDAVARTAESVPLPTPTDVTPVAEDASRMVDAVPQTAVTVAATVRMSTDSTTEQTQALSPPKGDARGGSAERTPRPSSHPDVPAVVQQAGHLIAGSAHVPTVDDRAIPLRAIQVASARASEHLASVPVHAGTLVHALTSTPAARGLRADASRLAGALLGTVAKTARAVLAADPLPSFVSPLQPLLLSTTPAELIPADAGGPLLQIGAPASPPAMRSSASAPTPSVPLASAAVSAAPSDRAGTAPEQRRSPASRHNAIRTQAISPRAVTAGVPTRGAHARVLPASATPPTPAPGGISLASGASGGAPSATPSLALLALLLMLFLPAALHRLRFAGQSLRATQFTLIPERPD
jgi:hypothetical protein